MLPDCPSVTLFGGWQQDINRTFKELKNIKRTLTNNNEYNPFPVHSVQSGMSDRVIRFWWSLVSLQSGLYVGLLKTPYVSTRFPKIWATLVPKYRFVSTERTLVSTCHRKTKPAPTYSVTMWLEMLVGINVNISFITSFTAKRVTFGDKIPS